MGLRDIKALIVIFTCLAGSIFILNLAFPLPVHKEYSKEILASDGTMLASYLTSDQKWRLRTNINEVSPELIKALITKEDKYFYWHPGINPFAIIRALYSNLFGKRILGASTISMQVARMLEPAERNYWSKAREILRAIQLEILYSKKEIIGLYISILPYGGNIEGIKAASYLYFQRSPTKLSLAQVISLTIIPNAPNKYNSVQGRAALKSERDKWIKRFISNHTFNIQLLKDALEEPLEFSRQSPGVMAPHFSRYIKDNYRGDQIKTCLDIRIQTICDKLLGEYVKRAIAKGVTNGAVLVIDNKTASVVGYCGSADFNNKLNKGEVNGVIAIRSPGSTLKPALFAEAFDSGELTPKMTIADIPVDYSGYAPENFTLDFKGEVTIESALRLSLNIPAVKTLNKMGVDHFIRLLEKAGFKEIAKKKKGLGLSLILGGCGATLEQLTRLYSSFANNGNMYELNYLKGGIKKNGINLFTPGAAYIISQILSTNERPDFPNYLLYSTRLPKIAWKTGTSFGKKDAWAIAYNPRYTIGVWIGNFDGKGAPQLSGAEMAVPLLFELFNAIDYSSDCERWYSKPSDVSTRSVCSETGLLPTEDCDRLEEDYYIINVSHNRKCDLYKEIFVSQGRSVQYCLNCLPSDGNWTKVKYPVYEPELDLWFTKTGRNIMRPPPHNPDCRTRFTS